MAWHVMTAADNSNEEGTVCTLHTSVDDDSATHIHDLIHRHHHHHHPSSSVYSNTTDLSMYNTTRLSQRHQHQH
jgi:hypothetical protein